MAEIKDIVPQSFSQMKCILKLLQKKQVEVANHCGLCEISTHKWKSEYSGEMETVITVSVWKKSPCETSDLEKLTDDYNLSQQYYLNDTSKPQDLYRQFKVLCEYINKLKS